MTPTLWRAYWTYRCRTNNILSVKCLQTLTCHVHENEEPKLFEAPTRSSNTQQTHTCASISLFHLDNTTRDVSHSLTNTSQTLSRHILRCTSPVMTLVYLPSNITTSLACCPTTNAKVHRLCHWIRSHSTWSGRPLLLPAIRLLISLGSRIRTSNNSKENMMTYFMVAKVQRQRNANSRDQLHTSTRKLASMPTKTDLRNIRPYRYTLNIIEAQHCTMYRLHFTNIDHVFISAT